MILKRILTPTLMFGEKTHGNLPVSLMYCTYYTASHAACSACYYCLDHKKSPGDLRYSSLCSANACRSLSLFKSAIAHKGSLISSVHLFIIASAVLTGIGFVSINII